MSRKHSVVLSANIAQSATTSQAIDVRDLTIKAIVFPTLTGTSITFTVGLAQGGAAQAGEVPQTFYAALDEAGAAITVTAQDGNMVVLTPGSIEAGLFEAAHWIKVVSGSTEAAAREIFLVGHKFG